MRLVFNFQITPRIFLKIFHFSSPTPDYTMNQSHNPLIVSHFQKRKKQTNKQTKQKQNKKQKQKKNPNVIQFLTVQISSGVSMGNTQEIRKFVNNGSIFQEKIPISMISGYFILPIKMHGYHAVSRFKWHTPIS